MSDPDPEIDPRRKNPDESKRNPKTLKLSLFPVVSVAELSYCG